MQCGLRAKGSSTRAGPPPRWSGPCASSLGGRSAPVVRSTGTAPAGLRVCSVRWREEGVAQQFESLPATIPAGQVRPLRSGRSGARHRRSARPRTTTSSPIVSCRVDLHRPAVARMRHAVHEAGCSELPQESCHHRWTERVRSPPGCRASTDPCAADRRARSTGRRRHRRMPCAHAGPVRRRSRTRRRSAASSATSSCAVSSAALGGGAASAGSCRLPGLTAGVPRSRPAGSRR